MRSYGLSIALALLVFTSPLGGIAQAREGGHFGGEHFGGEHFGGEHFGGERFGGEHRGPEHWGGHEGRGWRGEDLDRWHGGHWYHGDHFGRPGWWWVVGDGWFYYPAPIYPYPDPYAPPAVAGPSTGYWYYCTSAQAYYPYVTECPEAWVQVTPQPQP
jgi:hypothetical protein